MKKNLINTKLIFVQCLLRHGNTFQTAWLSDKTKLKKGFRVTLKNSDNPLRWWTIVEINDNRLSFRPKRNKWMETDFNRKNGVFVSKEWREK